MEQTQQIKSSKELRKMAREQLKGKWGSAALIIFVFGIVSMTFAIPFKGIGGIIRFIVGGALTLGFKACFIKIARRSKFELETLFSGFHNFGSALLLQLLNGIFVFLWSLLAIIPVVIIIVMVSRTGIEGVAYDPGLKGKLVFLGILTFVCVIPSIIAQYRYAMAYYILNDNPDVGSYEAIVRSKKMMKGNKWRLFWLRLTFIGWEILRRLPIFVGVILFAIYRDSITEQVLMMVLIGIFVIIALASSLFLTPYIETAKANFYENLKSMQPSEEGSVSEEVSISEEDLASEKGLE
ncbi:MULTISPECIES: DUF975 family protein [Clostridium]|uniref:DUF975 family protein n=1 Tax=Clostridium TaxID=1485 RepID=UPI00082446C6|nr:MULTISPECIES: DUF975 family protein [Clostridium]PJI09468.1 DUF975 domain-containing protein [Clostridium sp. CT7]